MNTKLEEKIDAVKAMSIEELCAKFNCEPHEICLGDYIARNTDDTVCPYKVILGFANFEDSSVKDLGPLEIVYGKKLKENDYVLKDINGNCIYNGINLRNSRIYSFGNLRKVYGTCSLGNKITSTGNLQYVGSNLYLNNTSLKTIDSDLIVDGRVNIEESCLESLGKLKKVKILYINSKKLKSYGELEICKTLILGKQCTENVRRM